MSRELSESDARVLEDYLHAKALAKKHSEEAESLRRLLLGAVCADDGSLPESLTVNGGEVARIRTVASTRLDTARLRQAWPDVYSSFAVHATHVRLEIPQ